MPPITSEQMAAMFNTLGAQLNQRARDIDTFTKSLDKTSESFGGIKDKFVELAKTVPNNTANLNALVKAYEKAAQLSKGTKVDEARLSVMRNAIAKKAIQPEIASTRVREALGLKTQKQTQVLKDEIKTLDFLSKSKKKGLVEDRGLFKSLTERKKYDLIKAQQGERIEFLKGGGKVGKLWAARLEQMHTVTDSFLTKTLGIQSAGLLKYAGIAGIAVLVANELIKTFADSAKGQRNLIRMGSQLNHNWLQTNAVMGKMNLAASLLGISVDTMQSYVTAATDEYIAGLYAIGATYKDVADFSASAELDRANMIINTVSKLTEVATGLGTNVEETVRSSARLGVMYGIPLEKLADRIQIIGKLAERTGIHAEDLFKSLEAVGSQMRFTNMSFEDINNQAFKFAGALYDTHLAYSDTMFWGKKFQSNFPALLKAGLEAGMKIGPEEYLAYLNKPIKDIGTAYVDAMEAGPIDKLAVMSDRLKSALPRGLAPKELAGQMAMFEPFKSMGALGAKLTTAYVTSGLTMKQLQEAGGDKEKWDLLVSKVPADQRQTLENIGGNILRLTDPLQFIAQLFTGFLRSWASFLTGFGLFNKRLDEQTMKLIQESHEDKLGATKRGIPGSPTYNVNQMLKSGG